jgi:hypothetical protein
MLSRRRAGRRLAPAVALARLSFLVLLGRAPVDVACLGHHQDPVDRPDLPQEGQRAESEELGLLTTPAQGGQRRLLGVRRVGSAPAMQTASTALAVAGLIALLGVAGTAAFLVDSITAPVRRAVRVLQAPAENPLDHRLRVTTGGEELPTPARVVSTDAERVADVPAVAPGIGEMASDGAEPRSVVPFIADVVREARLALEATMAAREAAKAVEAVAVDPLAACSGAATRYAAARGRALGPTTALWHAVEADRLVDAHGSVCETTVCGSLVRVSTEQRWPVAARDVCPSCTTLAH